MSLNKNIPDFVKLIISVLLCEVVGFSSGLLANAMNNPWFDALAKPSWNPPGAIFGPVWGTLYLLMGIAMWLVWKSFAPKAEIRNALIIFALQLFLNFWWSIIFFRFHSIAFAFIDILILLLFILITIFRFARFSKAAAWLLVPYISWVSFAAILNYTLFMLNKGNAAMQLPAG